MSRISNYPKTAKVNPNTFLIVDNPINGTKAIDANDFTNFIKEILTGGYTISVVDALPPVEDREPMTLYFLRKEAT